MTAPLSDRLQAWRDGGAWMSWRGHRIFYRQAGSGPPLLLLHGYPVGSYDWHALWQALAPHHTLIAPDMLVHGFPDKPLQGDYSLAAHAQLHDALLSHLGVTTVQAMAFDLGVSVVQEMLAQRQDATHLPSISALVLLNGGLCPQAYQPRLIQRLLVTRLGPWLGPRVSKQRFETTLSSLFTGRAMPPPQAPLDDFWTLLGHADGQAVTHRVGAFWHERLGLSARLLGALLSSEIPLRLINGSADPNSGEHMVQAFLRHAPATGVVRLADLGHRPQIQAPERVVQAVLDFLRDGTSAA